MGKKLGEKNRVKKKGGEKVKIKKRVKAGKLNVTERDGRL